MATKSINLLKKSIYSLLSSDSTLQTLLTKPNRVHYRDIPTAAAFPCVTYEIVTDTDNPFDESTVTGEVTQSVVYVNIFSISTGYTESDNIEAQIKALLHGKNSSLTNTEILCYSCLRTGIRSQRLDVDYRTRITSIEYRIRWASKPLVSKSATMKAHVHL